VSFDIRQLSGRKRRGEELSDEELRWVVNAYTAGEIDDAPMAAWLMAVCCQGMTEHEATVMTEAMADSGRRLDLSSLPGPTVDKHSTGGVGDKVTFVACPIAAACGAYVAKMSGRGLAHTGGTIDRLEAIPGLTCDLASERFLSQARDIGLVIASQTADLAPADGKIYALRDATGTVESPGLIASSVMSKKLAAGARAIVLDVTVGSGAFMPELPAARDLAKLMVKIGRNAGRVMGAVLTDMNQPLGLRVGNALEVEEALQVLGGAGPDDVREVSVTIAAWMLVAARLAQDYDSARGLCDEALDKGGALEKFQQMVRAQGGDLTALQQPLLGHSPGARGQLQAERAGCIARLDARQVGYASLVAGAGRRRKGEAVDPAAGISLRYKLGERVEKGDVLAEVYATSEDHLRQALDELAKAYDIADEPVEPGPLVLDVIAPDAEGGR